MSYLPPLGPRIPLVRSRALRRLLSEVAEAATSAVRTATDGMPEIPIPRVDGQEVEIPTTVGEAAKPSSTTLMAPSLDTPVIPDSTATPEVPVPSARQLPSEVPVNTGEEEIPLDTAAAEDPIPLSASADSSATGNLAVPEAGNANAPAEMRVQGDVENAGNLENAVAPSEDLPLRQTPPAEAEMRGFSSAPVGALDASSARVVVPTPFDRVDEVPLAFSPHTGTTELLLQIRDPYTLFLGWEIAWHDAALARALLGDPVEPEIRLGPWDTAHGTMDEAHAVVWSAHGDHRFTSCLPSWRGTTLRAELRFRGPNGTHTLALSNVVTASPPRGSAPGAHTLRFTALPIDVNLAEARRAAQSAGIPAEELALRATEVLRVAANMASAAHDEAATTHWLRALERAAEVAPTAVDPASPAAMLAAWLGTSEGTHGILTKAGHGEGAPLADIGLLTETIERLWWEREAEGSSRGPAGSVVPLPGVSPSVPEPR